MSVVGAGGGHVLMNHSTATVIMETGLGLRSALSKRGHLSFYFLQKYIKSLAIFGYLPCQLSQTLSKARAKFFKINNIVT